MCNRIRIHPSVKDVQTRRGPRYAVLWGESLEAYVHITYDNIGVGDRMEDSLYLERSETGWEVDAGKTAVAGGDRNGVSSRCDGITLQPAPRPWRA